jgi:O-antigen/teichoic acid export membrane protein/polysaccharide pyruvyl transferase WcaK-like protein
MRVILEPGSYTLQNSGDVAMLQVAYRRARCLWPPATIQVVTEAPQRLAEFCPGAVPLLAPQDRSALIRPNFLGRAAAALSAGARDRLMSAQEAIASRWPQPVLRLLSLKGELRTRDEVLAAFADALSRADLVAVTGSGMITDAFRRRASAFLTTLQVARARGAGTVMYSQGLGPVRDDQLRARVEAVLPYVDFISVRDAGHSPAFLDDLGMAPERVMVAGDDAIELAYDMRPATPGHALGINLRVARYAELDLDFVSALRPVVREASERTRAPLLPVPISHRGNADANAIRHLLAGWADGDGGEMLDSPAKVIEQVGRCRVVVTGSYHAAVFALAQGIPVVGLAKSTYYYNKFAGLAEQFGVGCEIARLDGGFAETLGAAIARLWNDAPALRRPLLRAAARQVALSQAAYRRTAELMESDRAVARASTAPSSPHHRPVPSISTRRGCAPRARELNRVSPSMIDAAQVSAVAAEPVPAERTESFWTDREPASVFARNVLSQYVVLSVNLGLGLVMLPFNVAHLGQSAYGLWVLVTSLTTYFDVLELGYGSAQVKFTAQYRARRDPVALNEVTSTLFFLFTGIALIKYTAAIILAYNIGRWLHLDASQARVGQHVLLIVSVYIATSLPFSVFGSVTNGFQRYHLNNAIFIVTSLVTAAVNIVVLLLGYGVVGLVTATTSLRILSLLVYRRSAYRAFPLLRIRWAYVSAARLREVTSLSAFLLIVDVANKVSYTADTVVITAILGTAPVAIYSVGQRLAMTVGRLTRVLSEKLFPTIVDTAALARRDRLQLLFIQGTRLSLAMVIPMCAVVGLLAQAIVMAWMGPRFSGSIPILQILAIVVAVKVGTMTSQSMLKGTENHRFLAASTMTMSLANLAMSIVLARRFGLVGVALGTLISASAVLMLVVFPKACRVVGLSLRDGLSAAVWPALWPAFPCALLLAVCRQWIDATAAHTVVAAACGGLLYAATFVLFAVPLQERLWYGRKISSLLNRRTALFG